MITPPAFVPCFYTVLFEKPASPQLMKLMAPTKGGDIEQVLVTSKDISSDIMAVHELENGVNQVVAGLAVSVDRQHTFNPIYLPMDPNDLAEKLEVDKDGDIQAVAGFGNPYISSHLQLSTEERPDMIDGKVCFKQFPLPQFTEMVEKQPLLS